MLKGIFTPEFWEETARLNKAIGLSVAKAAKQLSIPRSSLAVNGIRVGVRRIQCIRKQLDLRCPQRRRLKATTDSQHNLPVAQKLLESPFAVTGPY